tara:strand:+ start:44 stop:913 length:870 start_codon:yes stop_codon:yes gene_type:complete
MRKLISSFSHHLYKKNFNKYLYHFKINKSEYYSILKSSFEKSYSRFSPIHYLPANEFQSLKILYNFISLNALSEISEESITELVKEYNWKLKFKIRDQAIGLKLNDLSNAWGQKNVALFNCFNTIKFKEKVFKNIPLYGSNVLDFGCSIGCASFLSSNYGTFSHTISDVPGYPLDVAERSLKNCGLYVNKIPITDPSHPPEYEKDEFDVIYCLHTLEHTTNPIKTCKNILNSLKVGGYIIYTYYKASAPDGINTKEALEHRAETLKLLEDNTIATKIKSLNPFIVSVKK